MERKDFLKLASLSTIGAAVPEVARQAASQEMVATTKPNIVGVGLGGLYYEASDKVPYSIAERRAPGASSESSDELNKVTQSGNMKMVRMGDWKLIYDMMGYGQLYHLPSDPCELKNLFGAPSSEKERAQLMEELLMWTIRNQDSLPTGPQNKKYQTKWSKQHNWYAPYRHGIAPEAFIP